MILEEIKRSEVRDGRLWGMIEKANELTRSGAYASWDENAATLIPLMKRILSLARKLEEWEIYFYDMSMLFRLSRRPRINDVRLTFQVAEMFHQDWAGNLEEKIGRLGKRWHKLVASIASMILRFYLDYPQIDDGKISRALNIFLECEERYGSSWNQGDYCRVMELAVINRDKELAEVARKKLETVDFEKWNYISSYAEPMIEYYLLHKDFDSVLDMVYRICERQIPMRYQKCSLFVLSEGADKETFILRAFENCLQYGDSRMFRLGFDKWGYLYEKPIEGEIRSTVEVILHALAGEWSRGEERLRLAENDDRDRKQQRAPRECVYWSLCWHWYFRLLEKQGTRSVNLDLEERDGAGGGSRAWSCREAAGYFERQADCLGAEMDRARKRFGYRTVKKNFEEIFGYEG